MNFKPTLIKTIISVLAALILNFGVVVFMGGGSFLDNFLNALITFPFFWIWGLVLVYVLYSLVQH